MGQELLMRRNAGVFTPATQAAAPAQTFIDTVYAASKKVSTEVQVAIVHQIALHSLRDALRVAKRIGLDKPKLAKALFNDAVRKKHPRLDRNITVTDPQTGKPFRDTTFAAIPPEIQAVITKQYVELLRPRKLGEVLAVPDGRITTRVYRFLQKEVLKYSDTFSQQVVIDEAWKALRNSERLEKVIIDKYHTDKEKPGSGAHSAKSLEAYRRGLRNPKGDGPWELIDREDIVTVLSGIDTNDNILAAVTLSRSNVREIAKGLKIQEVDQFVERCSALSYREKNIDLLASSERRGIEKKLLASIESRIKSQYPDLAYRLEKSTDGRYEIALLQRELPFQNQPFSHTLHFERLSVEVLTHQFGILGKSYFSYDRDKKELAVGSPKGLVTIDNIKSVSYRFFYSSSTIHELSSLYGPTFIVERVRGNTSEWQVITVPLEHKRDQDIGSSGGGYKTARYNVAAAGESITSLEYSVVSGLVAEVREGRNSKFITGNGYNICDSQESFTDVSEVVEYKGIVIASVVDRNSDTSTFKFISRGAGDIFPPIQGAPKLVRGSNYCGLMDNITHTFSIYEPDKFLVNNKFVDVQPEKQITGIEKFQREYYPAGSKGGMLAASYTTREKIDIKKNPHVRLGELRTSFSLMCDGELYHLIDAKPDIEVSLVTWAPLKIENTGDLRFQRKVTNNPDLLVVYRSDEEYFVVTNKVIDEKTQVRETSPATLLENYNPLSLQPHFNREAGTLAGKFLIIGFDKVTGRYGLWDESGAKVLELPKLGGDIVGIAWHPDKIELSVTREEDSYTRGIFTIKPNNFKNFTPEVFLAQFKEDIDRLNIVSSGTLVEQQTLLHSLPKPDDAQSSKFLAERMTEVLSQNPELFLDSLTADKGKDAAREVTETFFPSNKIVNRTEPVQSPTLFERVEGLFSREQPKVFKYENNSALESGTTPNKPVHLLTVTPTYRGFLEGAVFGVMKKGSLRMERLDIPCEREVDNEHTTMTVTLAVATLTDQTILPRPLGGEVTQVVNVHNRGITRLFSRAESSVKANHLLTGEYVVDGGDDLKSIRYEVTVPRKSKHAFTEEQLQKHNDWIRKIGGEALFATQIPFSELPNCIKTIITAARKIADPNEKVLYVQNALRDISYYDLDDKKREGTREDYNLLQLINSMSDRLDMLRQEGAGTALNGKEFAGVCRHFAILGVEVYRHLGFATEYCKGIFVDGNNANTEDLHALVGIRVPGKQHSKRIHVELTPASALGAGFKDEIEEEPAVKTPPQEEAKQSTNRSDPHAQGSKSKAAERENVAVTPDELQDSQFKPYLSWALGATWSDTQFSGYSPQEIKKHAQDQAKLFHRGLKGYEVSKQTENIESLIATQIADFDLWYGEQNRTHHLKNTAQLLKYMYEVLPVQSILDGANYIERILEAEKK